MDDESRVVEEAGSPRARRPTAHEWRAWTLGVREHLTAGHGDLLLRQGVDRLIEQYEEVERERAELMEVLQRVRAERDEADAVIARVRQCVCSTQCRAASAAGGAVRARCARGPDEELS